MKHTLFLNIYEIVGLHLIFKCYFTNSDIEQFPESNNFRFDGVYLSHMIHKVDLEELEQRRQFKTRGRL